jgi:enolase
MARIKSIQFRKVLNSHVEFTTEFILELQDGSMGIGSSPKGETISIYEDKKITITPDTILRAIEEDGYFGRDLTQSDFDDYLQKHIAAFGRNNAFALSLSFFDATKATHPIFELFEMQPTKLQPPRLSLNILNGGWHAYTNPVLSDFSEFMLVAKSDNVEEVILEHNEIQREVREKQLSQEKAVVSGNPVNRFATADNRECIEFLLGICDGLGLANKYELMIDASAGDLWSEDGYRLAITDGKAYSAEQFHYYWMDIIRQYHLRFLEDPFREKDVAPWQRLTTAQDACHIIGDNFYSSDANRIEEGAAKRYTHGAVIKPNQAGTVTAVRKAAQVARQTGQIGITSHRSISTEETFVSLLTCMEEMPYIKIGPLVTDYSSVVRLNEIIRLTEA